MSELLLFDGYMSIDPSYTAGKRYLGPLPSFPTPPTKPDLPSPGPRPPRPPPQPPLLVARTRRPLRRNPLPRRRYLRRHILVHQTRLPERHLRRRRTLHDARHLHGLCRDGGVFRKEAGGREEDA